MKIAYCSLMLVTALGAQIALADDYRKIYDNTAKRLVEVCSEEADGTLTIAIRCHYNLIDLPFLMRPGDPIIKRKKTETTELSSGPNENSVYAIFNHALVGINYTMVDGRASVMIYQPSQETSRKYSPGDSWIAKAEDIALEVDEVDGYKKGDVFCLKNPPYHFPEGLLVKITHLFGKEHYATVDTVSDGVLGMGNVLKHYFTSFDRLIKCENSPQEKLTFDPNQAIKTSAPQAIDDIKVNTLQGPKENTSPTNTQQSESSIPR